MNTIRIGTRGSRLARWQAEWVAERLRENGVGTQIIEIHTSGDISQTEPIRGLGGTGVFTKEIQSALLRREIDLAVHSLKDLPTEIVPGLTLGAVPARESYRDTLCCATASSLETLPQGARIGTGSYRRKTQLEHYFPGRFRIEEIRGNLQTRLKKLDDGDYDVIVLAEAGLKRLGLEDRITCFLEPPLFLPAVGQGALGLEIREDDPETLAAITLLNDRDTFAAVSAERSMLKSLRGGCLAPIAALGYVQGKHLMLHGRVLSKDGQKMLEARETAPMQDALALGETLAQSLFRQGAQSLLEETRA